LTPCEKRTVLADEMAGEDTKPEEDEMSENTEQIDVKPKKTSSIRRSILAHRLSSYRYR